MAAVVLCVCLRARARADWARASQQLVLSETCSFHIARSMQLSDLGQAVARSPWSVWRRRYLGLSVFPNSTVQAQGVMLDIFQKAALLCRFAAFSLPLLRFL